MNDELIAQACHEANRVACIAAGDYSQKHWEDAEPWQRQSAVDGVQWRLVNMDAPASAQHDEWCRAKYRTGWKYGLVKDAQAKTHPCLVSYDSLPEHQKIKDRLFVAIVTALA